MPPPAESTAEAVDLSAGAVILEDQGTAAATASSTHQFFILPSLRSVYCSCFFSFWPYFEGIFVCTYSYVGFGPSPTHRFSLFVDLTMFNGSGGVQGALPRLRRRGINVGVAPLFSFFFLSFVERACVLAPRLGVFGVDTQMRGVQWVWEFCRLGRWLFGAFPRLFCMPSSCVFYLACL